MSQQVNLFNPLFVKQKKLFSALVMAQGVGAILLGMVLLYAYAHYQVAKTERNAEDTAKRLLAEQARLTQLAGEFAPARKSKALEDEVARLEAQLKARQKVLEVLRSGELGGTAGFSEYLRAFARQTIDGLWLTGFEIRGTGSQMAINGRALRPELVPAYIKRLNRERVMQGKSFSAMEISLPAAKPDHAAAKDVPAPPPRYVEFRLMSEREAGK